jgi:L-lactate dehydrogenase complex protein LldG
MTTSRETVLERVRLAVKTGQRAGITCPLEARGTTGYQAGGPDPGLHFREEFLSAGGQIHLAAGWDEAIQKVMALVQEKSARKVLVGSGAILDRLELGRHLTSRGLEVMSISGLSQSGPEPFFAADIGVSGVKYLIAETGTLVVEAQATEPRSLTLLPPVHIAVVHQSQILPDLFDLFDREEWRNDQALPSCLTLITGPSKTGDIELKLVTGVHGPGELHVVLIKE